MPLVRPARVVATLAAVVLAPAVGPAQPVLNQVDTFQTGTTLNWSQGMASAGLSIQAGGPTGAADNYLQIAADGVGATGRIIAFNQTQWRGNYIAAGITAIEMDLRSPTTSQPLRVRIAFKEALAAGYSSTTAFTLPNDGQWRHAVFFLSASEFTPINSPMFTFEQIISTNPGELRILHADQPAFQGDLITATLGVDNIRATAAPIPEPGAVLAVAAAGVIGWSVRRARRRV